MVVVNTDTVFNKIAYANVGNNFQRADSNAVYKYSIYVETEATIPNNFELSQIFPNPFNPTTQIFYELPQYSNVELIIYNTLGKEIIKLVNKNQAIDRYSINWNGQNSLGKQVPGGIYFYTLKTKDITQTRKMLLLR